MNRNEFFKSPKCLAMDIIRANGSPADAAIAAQFCLGVVVAESMGIGGGFFLTYYDRPSRKAYVLDAREKAPSLASENMFEGNDNASMYEGIPVSQHMALALSVQREWVLNEPSMSSFINPSTGDVYKEGEIMKRPKLVPTLRELQKDPDALYTGSLSDGPLWKEPVTVSLENGGYKMYAPPPPASGIILGYILNILDNYNFTSESLNDDNLVTTNQRIVEAFKYAYAKRTDLADEDFVNMTQLIANLTSEKFAFETYSKIYDNQTSQDPTYYGATVIGPESHGTDHLSVWGKDGSVIAITSTINLFFGAAIISESYRCCIE
ncbi:Gamma-glutamyltranspeptidase 1 [Armadillidium vulgare]|nr:Gamma-glutamyltranspeptidase 1 [Armadillidium vulgare]